MATQASQEAMHETLDTSLELKTASGMWYPHVKTCFPTTAPANWNVRNTQINLAGSSRTYPDKLLLTLLLSPPAKCKSLTINVMHGEGIEPPKDCSGDNLMV